ncbi:hypothetical protein ACH4F6_38035 [Streptomyces sp. NPDC017936]|uniref:hypothetical protein n=1 Tax=Streptomyces sp. NPDC017936 TaxID=3365016 RepID=UPI003792213A
MDAKTAKKIKLLQALIDHPRTGDNEREAARLMLGRLLTKAGEAHGITPEQAAGGWTDRRTYGAKYDRNLSTVQIAALVRAQIKLARKLAKQSAGEDGAVKLPDPIGDAPAEIKFSVRSERFAGGSSIDISILNEPKGWAWEIREQHGYPMEMATPAMRALVDELAGLLRAYNYDGSDITTDYFDVNFYGSVYAKGGRVMACA